jgi:hypothetical protein
MPMADLESLISKLPSWAILPATVTAMALPAVDKLLKVWERFSSAGIRADVKTELEIYKLRYEIITIKEANGLSDLGEERVFARLSKEYRPIGRKERFWFGVLGGVLPQIALLALIWRGSDFIETAAMAATLILGSLFGGAIARRCASIKRRLLLMAIGATGSAVVATCVLAILGVVFYVNCNVLCRCAWPFNCGSGSK